MESGSVTALLGKWNAGDRSVSDELVAILYAELRKLAVSNLKRRGASNTLQPTALIHEAWIKLAAQTSLQVNDRVHFFGICSHLMRQILVDNYRAKKSQKRGGDAVREELNEAIAGALPHARDVEALHLALDALEKLDARKAQAIELRYFGGLTAEEIATHLGIGVATVARDLKTGQAWLLRELSAK